jgi:hypothetical protein
MKSTSKKARLIDLADFDLQDLEALDPSNNFGQQKVRFFAFVLPRLADILTIGDFQRRNQFSYPLHRA